MRTLKDHAQQRKGRMQLSISQELLDRMAPLRDRVNFSTEAERRFAEIVTQVEQQQWIKRNSEALLEHGRVIANTGLAGAEFERI